MLIDYVGQELIWDLTATHPYKKNYRNYSIMIRCRSLEENQKVGRFLIEHLDNHYTDTEIYDNNGEDELIAKRITTFDVLGGEGEVIFLNEFKEDKNE